MDRTNDSTTPPSENSSPPTTAESTPTRGASIPTSPPPLPATPAELRRALLRSSTERSRLKAQLNEKDREISQIRDRTSRRITLLEGELERSREETKKQGTVADRMMQQNEDMSKQVEEVERLKRETNLMLRAKDEDIESKEAILLSMKADLVRLSKMTGICDRLKREKTEFLRQIEKLQNSLDTTKQENDMLRSETTILRESVETYKANSQNRASTTTTTTTTPSSPSSSSSEQELETLRSANATLQRNVFEATAEVERQQSKIASLETEIHHSRDRFDASEVQLTAERKNLGALEDLLKETKMESTRLRDINDRLKKKVADSSVAFVSLQERENEYRLTLNQKESERASLEAELESSRTEITTLQTEITTLQTEITTLRESTETETQHTNSELARLRLSHQESLSLLQTENLSLKSELSEMTVMRDDLLSRIESLRLEHNTALDVSQSELLSEREGIVAKMKTTLEETRIKHSNLMDHLQRELQEARVLLSQEIERADRAVREAEMKKVELEELKQERQVLLAQIEENEKTILSIHSAPIPPIPRSVITEEQQQQPEEEEEEQESVAIPRRSTRKRKRPSPVPIHDQDEVPDLTIVQQQQQQEEEDNEQRPRKRRKRNKPIKIIFTGFGTGSCGEWTTPVKSELAALVRELGGEVITPRKKPRRRAAAAANRRGRGGGGGGGGKNSSSPSTSLLIPDGVTHCISVPNVRTVKVVEAALRGCWICHPSWIRVSHEAGYFVDCENYGKLCVPPFDGLKVSLSSTFKKKSKGNVGRVKEFVAKGKGQFVSSETRATHIVIHESEAKREFSRAFMSRNTSRRRGGRQKKPILLTYSEFLERIVPNDWYVVIEQNQDRMDVDGEEEEDGEGEEAEEEEDSDVQMVDNDDDDDGDGEEEE